MNKLSNIDLFEICKEMNLPLNGIFFKDDLPPKLLNGFYIINLQSEMTNGRGTHWTAFYYDGKRNIYYDSFGFPPPEETEKLIKPFVYSCIDVQDIDSSSCGFYCVGFIKFLKDRKDKLNAFEKFINLFDHKRTAKNESILNAILYNDNKTYN